MRVQNVDEVDRARLMAVAEVAERLGIGTGEVADILTGKTVLFGEELERFVKVNTEVMSQIPHAGELQMRVDRLDSARRMGEEIDDPWPFRLASAEPQKKGDA